MKVRLFRRIILDGGRFARRGEVIDVSDTRGAQLVRRSLAEEVQATGKTARKAPVTKGAAAEAPIETRPSGSPTGQAITSSSLEPARRRRGRPSKKSEVAPE
jgi:hypothetical protein